MTKTKLKRK